MLNASVVPTLCDPVAHSLPGSPVHDLKSKIRVSTLLTSWQTDGKAIETGTGFVFLGTKIPADGDCHYEFKKHLLLGRKSMTNLGEGNGTPLQYSCLENPMEGESWSTAVHGVAMSRTRLSDFTPS